MSNLLWRVLFFVFCSFSGVVYANESIYLQKCSSCHGVKGEGNESMQAPVISGLGEAYLSRQLVHFKEGIRGGDSADASGVIMSSMAKLLTEGDIASVSQYLSSLPFVNSKPTKMTGGFMGKGMYMNCQSCHGAHAQGEDSLGAPRLAGQHVWYLRKQLKNFHSGIRGKHPDDKYGNQMVIVSKNLDFEQQVETILSYISHRKVPESSKSASSH